MRRLESRRIEDQDAARKIGLMFGITGIGITLLTVLGLVALFQGGTVLGTIDLSAALFLTCLLLLLRLKGYLYFCIYFGIAFMFCLYLYLVASGGIAGNAFLWSYTFPLFVFFLAGRRNGGIICFLYFLACLAILVLDLKTRYLGIYNINLTLRFILSLAAVILFSYLYEVFRAESHDGLLDAKNNLEKKVAERTRKLHQEVQQRKQREKELELSEAKYRDLYENSSDGISIGSKDGAYLNANQRFCERLGYTESELQQMPVLDLYARECHEIIKENIKKIFESGQVEFEALQISKANRHVPVEIRARRIYFENEAAILCSCRDITERKKHEEERRLYQEKMHRSSKMEAIGLMAGGVAHDLNNILAGVVSYPDLLLSELDEDDPQRESLEVIKQSGLRASAIVEDLLTVARHAAKKFKPMNPITIVEEHLKSPEHENIKRRFPSVHFKTNLDRGIRDIYCSPVHVKKCLLNLLLNAAEAMPDGGTCTISAVARTIDAKKGQQLQIKPGDYVKITVKDQGKGISDKDLSHIFEPFYTNKKMGRSGTGLGLAVVWSTMEEHDGTVTVTSDFTGTAFGLYFPTADHSQQESRNKEADQQESALPPKKVLVVDDEKHLREIAAGMLKRLGHKATTVESGEEALVFLQNHSVDLVILDMLMEPGMNGLETYKKILSIHPGQKAIVASGFSKNKDVTAMLELGAGCFIKKPYVLAELAAALQKTLA